MLLNVKVIVSENPTDISSEIKNLINREADLMNRGRPSRNLFGVRERILKLFLYYIRNEEMNPEIKIFRQKQLKGGNIIPVAVKL